MSATPDAVTAQVGMGAMIYVEALHSCALDGDTQVVGVLSTSRPESVLWWHERRCMILASGQCSCTTATGNGT